MNWKGKLKIRFREDITDQNSNWKEWTPVTQCEPLEFVNDKETVTRYRCYFVENGRTDYYYSWENGIIYEGDVICGEVKNI